MKRHVTVTDGTKTACSQRELTPNEKATATEDIDQCNCAGCLFAVLDGLQQHAQRTARALRRVVAADRVVVINPPRKKET